ncbi:hypothetical protein [Geomesophilobacter sediminis]|uniref:DUF5640 domain-containing protein n=1 Tax=Geomesophilobacter sediminis TaxID=2798584 RepID=A0A8J7M1F3_9BACT|nr:hypothetical protein [Geomesophilobacter sediminis]MBJ6726693.1 hypothetical protein [Geomesophilobacter sediminis]
MKKVLLLSALLLVFGCSKGKNELVGQWESGKAQGGKAAKIEFFADHTATLSLGVGQPMKIKWSMGKNGQVKLQSAQDRNMLTFQLNGDKLAPEGGDGVMTFTKQ